MNTRSLFALAIRIIGLLLLISVLNVTFGFIGSGLDPLPWLLVIKLIISFIVSIWMLRGAPAMVRFAYRDGEEK